jgi:hypothetical protein
LEKRMADDGTGPLGDIEKWPASRLKKLPGDVFGNGSSFLWRCDVCGGHFIHSGEWGITMTMGLISFRDEEEEAAREKRRAAAWSRAKQLVSASPCDCSYHAWLSGMFFE